MVSVSTLTIPCREVYRLDALVQAIRLNFKNGGEELVVVLSLFESEPRLQTTSGDTWVGEKKLRSIFLS